MWSNTEWLLILGLLAVLMNSSLPQKTMDPTDPEMPSTTVKPEKTDSQTSPTITVPVAPDTTTIGASTSIAPDTTTIGAPTSIAPDTTTIGAPTSIAPDTTTVGPTTTVDPCNMFLTASTTSETFSTMNYPSNYINDMDCKVTISAPEKYVINLSFDAFEMESEPYCTYDNMAVYDGTSASAPLLGQYCGTSPPATIQSSLNSLYINFVSDYAVNYTGAKIAYVSVNNAYPACKAAFTPYTATSKATPISISSPYANNMDEYFLILNPGGDLILQLTVMDIELSANCIYDKITIYNGGCRGNTTFATHCGTFLKRWELTGAEYLVHFHSDGNVNGRRRRKRSTPHTGFSMEYFIGTANTGAPTTTTTTVGPPLAAEVNLVNEVLEGYVAANMPRRDLSSAISSTVDMFLVGINDLDEVYVSDA